MKNNPEIKITIDQINVELSFIMLINISPEYKQHLSDLIGTMDSS